MLRILLEIKGEGMQKKIWLLLATVVTATLVTSCSTDKNFKQSLEKTLEENPEIITNVVVKNPEKFMNALKQAAMEAKRSDEKNRAQREKQELENYIKNPLKFTLRSDELIRGAKDGKIRIIEYSDFQCPFCSRGFDTIKKLLDKYPNDIAFVYKHLPIDSIHPQARLASQYYEAVRIIAGEKAFKFHDTLLKNQRRIRAGESYLKSVVKELGLDVDKVAKVAQSEEVRNRIKEDIDQANQYGFSGTPGFLVEGVPVKGAYPFEYFEKIITMLKEAKKI